MPPHRAGNAFAPTGEIQDNIFNLALDREPQHYGIITATPD